MLKCLACGTPMGDAEVCPACGWTYRVETDASAASDSSLPGSAVPQDDVTSTESEPSLAISPGVKEEELPAIRLLAEITAVLAMCVVPNFINGVASLWAPPAPPWPPGLTAFYSIPMSACAIYVTLYLIHRSGEPRESFGLTRPGFIDLLIGVGLMLAAEAIALFWRDQVPWYVAPPSADNFTQSRYPSNTLLVIRLVIGSYSEELVARAYLVTRLTQLFKSQATAVLVAAAFFASYHCYFGAAGVLYAFVFGIVYGAVFQLVGRIWPLAIGHALYCIRLDLVI